MFDLLNIDLTSDKPFTENELRSFDSIKTLMILPIVNQLETELNEIKSTYESIDHAVNDKINEINKIRGDRKLPKDLLYPMFLIVRVLDAKEYFELEKYITVDSIELYKEYIQKVVDKMKELV